MADSKPLTAAEWATTDELWRMLKHALAAGVFTARKQLLFGVDTCWYCCESLPPEYYPVLNELNRIADRPDLPVLRAGKMVYDRFDREGEENEEIPLSAAHRSVRVAARSVMNRRLAELLPAGAVYHEGYPGFEPDERVFYAVAGHVFAAAAGDGTGSIVRSAAEADILRDLLGDPFRPVTFAAEWRTDTAVALARQMYESRDFGAMPILADALQDAGCDSADILTHCREANRVHVRGCWVVDLVLGQQ